MAADALAPFITRSSAIIILTMQDKWVLVFHEEEFQVHLPSECWEIIKNANIFLSFPK